jgi:hypothetical protein
MQAKTQAVWTAMATALAPLVAPTVEAAHPSRAARPVASRAAALVASQRSHSAAHGSLITVGARCTAHLCTVPYTVLGCQRLARYLGVV